MESGTTIYLRVPPKNVVERGRRQVGALAVHVQEVDARGESGDAAPPTATTATESNDDGDGPEFAAHGGIYLNNPAGRFFYVQQWIFINGVLMFGPACGIYYGNKDAYDANILRLYPDSTDGLWVALTLFAFLN